MSKHFKGSYLFLSPNKDGIVYLAWWYITMEGKVLGVQDLL